MFTNLKYYREANGDYLAIDTSLTDYFNQEYRVIRVGRATAIAGDMSSVCPTVFSDMFFKQCARVRLSKIPSEWLRMF